MKTRAPAVAVAAITGIAMLAATSGAQDPTGPTTLDLSVAEQRCKPVDDGRRGDSLGDRNFCAGRVDGDRSGSVRWTCTFQGSERKGDHCTASVALRGGTLEAAGRLSHTRPRSTWAVTGGTGDLAGARGTVTLLQRSATRVDATVVLLGAG
jgi:hypothetical protein